MFENKEFVENNTVSSNNGDNSSFSPSENFLLSMIEKLASFIEVLQAKEKV